MKHLAPDELVDLLDGAGSSSARAHAASCDECRKRLDELGTAMRLASEAEVPEPSPLFWDHLSARVRERIAEEPAADGRRGWSWSRVEAWRWAVPIALGFAVLLLVVSRLGVSPVETPAGEQALGAPAGVAVPPGEQAGTDVEVGSGALEDASWTVLASISEDLSWDDAVEAGLTVAPGAADRAALQLTADEQRELVRLLRAELGTKGT
ncbi:MAG: hypothetical protein HYZ58_08060 [Acidobacteria bacterium]|nr:hypothetical protein [Acidobacteriota bacterium]MBI3263090.1 hypothetical protein [Acidobacteriota bacterium]